MIYLLIVSRTKIYDWPGVAYHSHEWWRRWRVINSDKAKEYHRNYSKKRYKTHYVMERARRERWKTKNVLKVRAHKIVYIAVRSGRLIRQPCYECETVKTVAHHDYYGKPLDVKWLCEVHHKAHHKYLLSINHDPNPTEQEAVMLLTPYYHWR